MPEGIKCLPTPVTRVVGSVDLQVLDMVISNREVQVMMAGRPGFSPPCWLKETVSLFVRASTLSCENIERRT